MTVASTQNRISYAGNDVITAFAFPYLFFANTDLKVILVVDATGVETVQTIDTHYSVTGAGEESGGTVTMVTPPATGESLVIIRELSLTQDLDLVENDALPAEEVEKAFDRQTMMVQQAIEAVGRSVTLPEGFTGSFDGTLPTPVANTAIVVNSTGDGLAEGPTVTDIASAQTNATAAAASATAAASSASNAATSETNAANSAAQAEAAAQGWKAVSTLTTGTHDIETTDAKSYYIIDASGGAVTINLPAIGTNDGILFGFESNNVDNTITFVRDGTDTINGVAGDYTAMNAVGDVIHFIGDDSSPDNWIAIAVSRVTADGVTLQLVGRTMSIKSGGVTPDLATPQLNAQTGTSYTAALSDNLKLITMTNASANTLTVPTNASVAFPVGSRFDVAMLGAGVTTVQGDTGVTINGVSAGALALSQYGGASLTKTGTDTWLLIGGTVA